MYRYGIVTFHHGGEKGAKFKKLLVEKMNRAGVITVSEIDIKNWYNEDCKEPFVSTHKYALHDKDEADVFKAIMESKEMQDESIEWRICRFDRDPKLRKWIKGVEKRRKEAEKNGKRTKV